MEYSKVHKYTYVKKKLRGYKADEHMAHQDYAKFAGSEGLTKAEKQTLRGMSHDEARHERNIKRIQSRLKNG